MRQRLVAIASVVQPLCAPAADELKMNGLQAFSGLRRFLPAQQRQQSGHMLASGAAALIVKAPPAKVARGQDMQLGFGPTCQNLSAPVCGTPMSPLNRTAA